MIPAMEYQRWLEIRASAPLIPRLQELRKRLYAASPGDIEMNVTLTDAIEVLQAWEQGKRPKNAAKCKACGSPFIRNRRQIYCSTACASQSFEQRRKGTRNEYMRELMRKRREVAKLQLRALVEMTA